MTTMLHRSQAIIKRGILPAAALLPAIACGFLTSQAFRSDNPFGLILGSICGAGEVMFSVVAALLVVRQFAHQFYEEVSRLLPVPASESRAAIAWTALLGGFLDFVGYAVVQSFGPGRLMSGEEPYVFPIILRSILITFGWLSTSLSGILLYQRLFRQPDNTLIETAVHDVIDSARFLSALRTVLPRGIDDAKHGFDHIPFMLHSLDERRERSARAGARFLTATITLGVCFTGLLAYYGFFVISEGSIGTGQILKDSAKEVHSLQESVVASSPDVLSDKRYTEVVLRALNDLQESTVPNNLNATKKKIDEAIDALRKSPHTDQFALLRSLLADNSANLPAWSRAQAALQEFSTSREGALDVLRERSDRLDKLISELTNASKQPEARTAELLKRLSIGLVVASFFLAILRYLAGLYREQEQQTASAERAELDIRKFYVAFRCAGENTDQQKVVLSALLNANPSLIPTPEKEERAISDELLKELLAVITKKL